MGVTSAVHWWEESQMRVLVLVSLVVQFLLFVLTFFRNRAMPGLIRFVMWLAYLGGDAIAIYALATLFNRHKDQDRGGKNTLEVVWAPILLLHLGGHDGITAYNIEDNELWTRHLVTAVSQVTVAIYVFAKSWQGGDKRLLQAAIVLFVPGVLKCFGKPWALRRASIKSLVSSPSTQRTREQTKEGMKRLEEYVQQGRAKASVREQKDKLIPDPPQERGSGCIPLTACLPPRPRPRRRQRDTLHGKKNEGEMDAFERYLDGAMAGKQNEAGAFDRYLHGAVAFVEQQKDTQHHPLVKEKEMDLINKILHGEAYKLFVDLSSPYPLRLSIFKCFWVLSEERVEKAYGSVRQGLASAFMLLYTKVKFSFTAIVKTTQPDLLRGEEMNFFFAYFVEASRVILPWVAIGLFHHSHREVYSGIDVKITYALFCCTAFVEVLSSAIFEMAEEKKEQWPEMVAQYNLIEYYARNKKHHKKMWIASKSGCKDLLDQHWFVRSCFSSGPITMLVLEYLKDGWKKKIRGSVSYKKFNDNRGHWALESYQHKLGWSIKAPFDESVLLWHIATDFCFFWKTPLDTNKAVHCTQMSNYMVYLLFVNPEMLLPGTRRNLFTSACNELKDILGDNKPSLFAKLKDILMDNEQDVCRRVRTAMEELKGILLTDKKWNPTSRSQWKYAPLTEEGIIERVNSSIRDKSTQASEGQESKQGSEDSKSESKQELEERGCKQNFITKAWALAQGLQNLGDEEMWEVIETLWTEMLCFSASRCRGYLHAKALGSGGEFLSYVWLLRFYMGMETFTERLQRERDQELPSHEANNHGASPSTSHPFPGVSTSPAEFIVDIEQGPTSGPRGG